MVGAGEMGVEGLPGRGEHTVLFGEIISMAFMVGGDKEEGKQVEPRLQETGGGRESRGEEQSDRSW